MGSSTTTDGTATKRARGPLPQGDAARFLAAGFMPVFASLPLLVSRATEINALPLFLIAPIGVVLAAGVVYLGSRRAKEPVEWLDDGSTVLRVVGAGSLALGIVVFTVGAFIVPTWTVALWLLVPLSCAIGVWLSFLGAKRLRPEVVATFA